MPTKKKKPFSFVRRPYYGGRVVIFKKEVASGKPPVSVDIASKFP